jgi:Skp family chaperone for outer membrane proteins
MSQNQKKEESLEELFKKYVERHQKEINEDFAKKMKEQLDALNKAIEDLKKVLKEK